MNDLFQNVIEKEVFAERPLAFRMRPDTIQEYVGQAHLLSEGSKLRNILETSRPFSMIFFGPPGCGKSALSNIIAAKLKAVVRKINAVSSNVKEIRQIIEEAKLKLLNGKKTLLLIDEIHRFNKSQQDALLPDVEAGNISIIGITTENPYFFISGPLLSRASIFKFEKLNASDIVSILKNAIKNFEKGLGENQIKITENAMQLIANSSDGDARFALNILEIAALDIKKDTKIDEDIIEKTLGDKKLLYDRTGDQHYDTISAFIKSIRGSDPDASLLYLAKMLKSGEDPRFIARRLVILASEDVGNADPNALNIATSAFTAVEYIGMPESRIILAQAALYLACAPKSNASYEAIKKAYSYVEANTNITPPKHLTKVGAKDYKYPHSYKYGYVRQKYSESDVNFYKPTNRGHEKLINKYLEFLKNVE